MITIDGGTGKVLHNGVDIASRIMIDQWRRNAALSTSGGQNFLTTDWERVDGTGQGVFIPGGGMTESGGIFTFPMTGIYKVEWQAYAEDTDGSASNSINVYVTTNNSDYNSVGIVRTDVPDGAGETGSSFFLFDVTNTSTHKVRFTVTGMSDGSSKIKGDTNYNQTAFIFQKLNKSIMEMI